MERRRHGPADLARRPAGHRHQQARLRGPEPARWRKGRRRSGTAAPRRSSFLFRRRACTRQASRVSSAKAAAPPAARSCLRCRAATAIRGSWPRTASARWKSSGGTSSARFRYGGLTTARCLLVGGDADSQDRALDVRNRRGALGEPARLVGHGYRRREAGGRQFGALASRLQGVVESLTAKPRPEIYHPKRGSALLSVSVRASG